ncbi:hypothetical protein [Massilia sp. TSP1-1-2]|uniref:hypothetical protein n=1 Tax=unclassified Massilia TaxID=2609279 RepID=UPI003CE69755
MPSSQHRRNAGQQLLYSIAYDQGEYFITRDGVLKKSVPDAMVAGIVLAEATPELMLRTAIADIEALIGMDE